MRPPLQRPIVSPRPPAAATPAETGHGGRGSFRPLSSSLSGVPRLQQALLTKFMSFADRVAAAAPGTSRSPHLTSDKAHGARGGGTHMRPTTVASRKSPHP